MLKRLVVPALVLAGAGALASLGVVVGGPAAHGAVNVCVNVNGTQRFQSGTTGCGGAPGNTAVAVGDGAGTSAGSGNRNTAIAVGAATASAGSGNRNTATAVGPISTAAAGPGNNNRATAVGPLGVAVAAGGNNNSATAVRCTVAAGGSDNVRHCP